MELKIIKANEQEIRKVLNELNYKRFTSILNDQTGEAKRKRIEHDLNDICNAIKLSKSTHQKFTIILAVGAIVSNYLTADDTLSISY